MKAMIKNKFLFTLILSAIFYFVLDFFFNDMMLYVVGGVIGTPVKFITGSSILVLLVWLLILTGVIVLFYKLKNAIAVYLFAAIIACLLYIIDFIAYEFLPNAITSAKTTTLITIVLVVIKSLVLSIIIYGRRRKATS